MRILFICKYNRFRSKVAEAFFNKINKNPKYLAKSAGFIKGSPISKEIKQAAQLEGVSLKGQPHGLTTEILKWQDLSIIICPDIPKSILENEKHGKKTLLWEIEDTDGGTNDMRPIIRKIKKRVTAFVEELK